MPFQINNNIIQKNNQKQPCHILYNKFMEKYKISIVFGTRPEVIKLAPLIKELKSYKKINCNVCTTGQHKQMLEQTLRIFDITPDVNLNVMKKNQSLSILTSNILTKIEKYIKKEKPQLIIVHGDTTTALSATLAAFYQQIPVAHVEAGLRTHNLYSPWPEEANRIIIDKLCSIHFVPTEENKNNLLKENIDPHSIFITGNTVVDAILWAKKEIKNKNKLTLPNLYPDIYSCSQEIILITGHRRENFGSGFEKICRAISRLATKYTNILFVYPVHLNPNVSTIVHRMLGNYKNIRLISPLQYLDFVYLMNKSKIILTDSGGIQEEAPTLQKPVLLMRENTERPESNILKVGTSSEKIIKEVDKLINNKEKEIKHKNPYGDGKASERIAKIINNYLKTMNR